jgi:hypothetical protein
MPKSLISASASASMRSVRERRNQESIGISSFPKVNSCTIAPHVQLERCIHYHSLVKMNSGRWASARDTSGSHARLAAVLLKPLGRFLVTSLGSLRAPT